LAPAVADADSIKDVDRLRHAGNGRVFGEIRAPRPYARSCGRSPTTHEQQLNAVLRQALIALAGRAPLLPGAGEVVFVDLDSTRRQVYGYAKQGAAVGRSKGRKTLHRLTHPAPPARAAHARAHGRHRGLPAMRCRRPARRCCGVVDIPAVQPMVLTATGGGSGIPPDPLRWLRFTRAGTSRSVAAADDGACW